MPCLHSSRRHMAQSAARSWQVALPAGVAGTQQRCTGLLRLAACSGGGPDCEECDPRTLQCTKCKEGTGLNDMKTCEWGRRLRRPGARAGLRSLQRQPPTNSLYFRARLQVCPAPLMTVSLARWAAGWTAGCLLHASRGPVFVRAAAVIGLHMCLRPRYLPTGCLHPPCRVCAPNSRRPPGLPVGVALHPAACPVVPPPPAVVACAQLPPAPEHAPHQLLQHLHQVRQWFGPDTRKPVR